MAVVERYLNTGIVRPPKGRRYLHRQLQLTVDAGGAARGQVSIPSPGRLIAVNYGQFDTTFSKPRAVATSGALTIYADYADGSNTGRQVLTDADLSSVPTAPLPVGTTAVDEGRAATAATDAFSGGFPVRRGAGAIIASGTENEVIYVDFWFRLCTYVRKDLISQSGADGSGVFTGVIPLGGPGVLAALALDFQNMPATTDIVIKADASDGATLFTSTSSLTDLAPALLGRPGGDEAIAATAATDGTECGNAFQKGLYFDMAQADAFTTGNEKVIAEFWIDD